MVEDDQPEHVQGVDFTEINPLLEKIDYPVTTEELIDQYGDRELERTNADPISLAELFSYAGDASYESEEELRQMILGQMPKDSEGRAGYSDRGGSGPEQTEEAEEAEEQTSADIQDGVSTDTDTTQQ
ncbi:hypothetical protein BRC78_04640 [Halobacteriales archaeon QH_8_68_33]|nr:MAG: hypothetical protein BRC78_04640 [Halobacteriales archaeon QH_8_68_33]